MFQKAAELMFRGNAPGVAQDFRAVGRLSAIDVDSPLSRVLGSLRSRLLGLGDPFFVPEN